MAAIINRKWNLNLTEKKKIYIFVLKIGIKWVDEYSLSI